MAERDGGTFVRKKIIMRLDGKEMSLGKYTRWAKDLTEDQMHALLWLVGEHCIRSHMGGCFALGGKGPGVIMQEGTDESFEGHYNSGMKRKARAYNLILEFHRKPFGIDEAKQRMLEVLK
jgi:hypothetical protein